MPPHVKTMGTKTTSTFPLHILIMIL